MYCKNCGKQISTTDAFCPYCGALNEAAKNGVTSAQPVRPTQPTSAPPPRPAPAPIVDKTNTLAIVGFVLALLGITLPGIICSIVGLQKANQGADHKGLAIAGIVLSVLWIVGCFFLGFLIGFLGVLGDLSEGFLCTLAFAAAL